MHCPYFGLLMLVAYDRDLSMVFHSRNLTKQGKILLNFICNFAKIMQVFAKSNAIILTFNKIVNLINLFSFILYNI